MINFKKKFGQNFLTDGNLLSAIVEDSGVTSGDVVVEVGPGAGALTQKLASKAKQVFAFEIDTELQEVLEQNLAEHHNVQVIFKDFMNISSPELEQIAGSKFKVVANLPYYITSPLITKFLTSGLNVDSITVMVQKEVGERIIAQPRSKDYGVLSIMVQLCSNPTITRQIGRQMFTPVPNVDSCLVHMEDICVPKSYDKIVELVKLAFSSRRKTLVNNLSKAYGKDEILKNLSILGISANARAEELSASEYNQLYCLFDKK